MTRISLKSAANKISIHAPPRGATRLRMAGRTGEKFQFTPLREGRPFRPCDQPCATAFSIHAPPRGATAVSATMSRLRDFNSRPSARGDHHLITLGQRPRHFQFTPLREGRHKVDSAYVYTIEFSIHAPPRGATEVGGISNMRRISIHAPPRGATRFAAGSEFPPVYFNSRPSARGDHRKDGKRMKIAISIHAPPRGATRSVAIFSTSSEFQFTPLREGRRGSVRHAAGAAAISIHAPPRGATLRRI